MRFVTYSRTADPKPRVGVLTDGSRVLDLAEAAKASGRPLPFDPSDMVSLIAAGKEGLEAVRRLAAGGAGGAVALDAVRLHAPVPRPRKNVFCLGWNYLEHFKEGEAVRQSGQQIPDYPVFFSKTVTAVTGPRDPIPFDPKVSEKIDWEVELVVVIGTGGKNIPESRAMEHVFGYTAMNDVSARDLQRRHGGQWFKGKSLDGHCPMGPCIVTADEVDPNGLRVRTRVNGVTKQDSNTRHFYFKIPRVIAELSLGLTLEPGDLISTGTPEGVGFGRTPPEFLKPGDLLETEVEGVGVLQNRIGG
jgi:2-keto-4-pentenoate hydratase/2-oxohepta-3-ene-1,7-dioic acid hydratase in catechol pathway